MSVYRAQRTAGGAAIYGDESALAYTATLAGLSSASALGSISATYTAPAGGAYTAALAGLASTPVLGGISVSYVAPGLVRLSASPIGRRLSTAARLDALSTMRRPTNLSKRTR